MKRGTFFAIILGCLLPMPFVLVTGMVWKSWSEERTRRAKESPILALEETWKLQTYSQKCWRGADCESPLGCLSFSANEREGLCSDSWCKTDLQCRDGSTCQTLPTLDEGPLVRACVFPGLRKEGEACVLAREPRDRTCAQGLHCNAGWCGRPCQSEVSTSCPEGFFCRSGIDGPSCLPTCEVKGCPEGQQCISMGEGISVCAVVRGENCQKVPCSEDRLCSLWPPRYKESRLELRMACAHFACGTGRPACPPGTSCVQGACRRTCEPVFPDAGPAVCQPRHP